MISPTRLLLAAAFSLLGSANAETQPQRPWSEDVMYFAMTDRFYDGDPENNVPSGSDPALYDKEQTNISRYHGGDFRGIEIALKNGYFEALGVTAIWITPPLRNVWYSGFDLGGPKTGYHGYWTQDFLDIDPHLISRRSIDGATEYPDSRDGRMQHYKDLVALAHSKGIKIVQDIVCNHAGPVFYYDVNGNGRLDVANKLEWEQPFNRTGQYNNAQWADTAKWNQHRTAPDGPITILGREVKTSGLFANVEAYGRKGMSGDSLGKSDGEEIVCDFFSLRDFATQPEGANFNRLVEDFVEVYAFYLEEIGVDGFRIDTVKHVHHPFWDAFTERLRNRLGPERAKQLLLFGEIYDGAPEKLGQYTYRSDWPTQKQPCLDSVLDFSFMYAARAYLRVKDQPFGTAKDIVAGMRSRLAEPLAGMSRPAYNPFPGADGLTAAQKLVNFVENHDGLNRFRVKGVTERRNLVANALLLTAPGIPCLYYGTEESLEDSLGKIGSDSETGRLTFVNSGGSTRFDTLRNDATFKSLAGLAKVRRDNPALTSAAFTPIWVDVESTTSDDGVFAYVRGGDEVEPVVVVVNASEQPSTTGSAKLLNAAGRPFYSAGDKLERIQIPGLNAEGDSGNLVEVRGTADAPQAEFQIGPESVSIYRKVR